MDENEENESVSPVKGLQGFISSSRRVLTIAHKPDNDTFKTMLKVIAIGILIIGALGFIIQLIFAFGGLGR